METNVVRYGISQVRDLLHPLIKDKKITFSGVADWYVFSLFVLPSYFGIRMVFFDLTAVRFFEVLLLLGIYVNKKRRADFIALIKRCPNIIFIALYSFVLIYTDLYRRSISSILYWLMNCVLVLFCVAYLIVYEYVLEEFVKKVRKCAWIIAAVSPLELVIGKPPFSFLDTLNKSISSERFGNTRIMGNCSTTNGYAMYLMILLPLFCYDWEKKRIDIGKNKFLIALIGLNIFLTGSRLTVGTLILAFFYVLLRSLRALY
ncbi:MAG: hypothetical protein LUH07_00230 [Lachnospiraceae bacterium]|nr:hypothetical protein [Lachnospiraceae bacterium]